MKKPISVAEILSRTNIVGVVASEADSEIAWGNPFSVDIIEWRVDRCRSETVQGRMKTLPSRLPLIITVRDRREGGAQRLEASERVSMYKEYMPLASFVDIEASTADELGEIIKIAKDEGVGVIISQHCFCGPWDEVLTERAAEICHQLQGDIFKVVLLPDSFNEFGRFITCVGHLQTNLFPMRIAAMAIGKKFGKVSRLLFAAAGSPLVYGYFGEECVEGQWHVANLRGLLAKI